jgi:hypothetical protein
MESAGNGNVMLSVQSSLADQNDHGIVPEFRWHFSMGLTPLINQEAAELASRSLKDSALQSRYLPIAVPSLVPAPIFADVHLVLRINFAKFTAPDPVP